mmetsp:Transcript_7727/g.17802  ORF Transcript_7727/g.17802 Transcript_7727/m.17802 type:complete len:194 (+) Transcript_7727:75-656(+)
MASCRAEAASCELAPKGPLPRLAEALQGQVGAEEMIQALQEENFRLRIGALQRLRKLSLLRLCRAILGCWQEHCAKVAASARHCRVLDKAARLLSQRGANSQTLMQVAFQRWQQLLPELRALRCIFEELAAHRQGRSRLLQQYHHLEAQLLQSQACLKTLREDQVIQINDDMDCPNIDDHCTKITEARGQQTF